MTAKAIMIQGTMSSAGKSLLAAGFCRVFRQDGYRVAPFKSQNMALNSFITREGLEMGRAQVMQAEAAGIEPQVDMNPILLKPQSDTGSQVIVNGEVLGVMSAVDYFAMKKSLVPDILAAYGRLAAANDIIVLEGAGSPAEINLKRDDIVNMGMAKMAQAPVLLAGDIDRGGVFASLYGTMALLEAEERRMVKGTIINKFRGDEAILRPGLTQLETLTGVPVLGVVPWLNIDLDDEDSLSQRLDRRGGTGAVRIAVIRLPHLSNFTDFAPLERLAGVALGYVKGVEELRDADFILLPGTKNTMGDLAWLRQNGLEAAIQQAAARGTPVMGICGGYQMLGRSLSDPLGVEAGGEMAGMGLLPARTIFEEQKVRTRSKGTILRGGGALGELAGRAVEGYEIHMGRTLLEEGAEAFSTIGPLDGGREVLDGGVWGNVCGTYLHGIFDQEAVGEGVAQALFRRKGLRREAAQAVSLSQYKESQYDLLGAAMRQAFDMKRIYEILEAGV